MRKESKVGVRSKIRGLYTGKWQRLPIWKPQKFNVHYRAPDASKRPQALTLIVDCNMESAPTNQGLSRPSKKVYNKKNLD